MPKLYIIIVNYNSWRDTLECLHSLKESIYKDFQIILVDNHSPNDSVVNLKKNFEKNDYVYYFFETFPVPHYENLPLDNSAFNYPILFVESSENLGFAGGNNIALRYLVDKKVQYDSRIFLLNPDTTIENDALLNLMNTKEKSFISGCHIKSYDDHSISYYGAYRFNIPLGMLIQIKNPIAESKLVDYIHGGALFTTLATIKKIGLMPSDYFLYWEEADWCYKAKLQGIPLLICNQAIIYDKIGTSIGRGVLAYYYYARNGFIFYKKYFRKYIPLLLAMQLLRGLLAFCAGKRDVSKGYYLGIKDYFNGARGYKNFS